MGCSAIVAIPVYKRELNLCERASLTQLRKVLGAYEMCFVAPESLAFDYGALGEGISVRRFPDTFFVSNLSYSELLLEPAFYEGFLAYEYLLIYQLDAFVFRDRLEEFCRMGYDYIGAPLKSYAKDWKEIGCNVGNGGFSLRRVKSCLRVTRCKEELFAMRPKTWAENRFLPCEDVFFAFCSTVPSLTFHVPPFRTALEFAVGTDTAHIYKKMPAWLPFGCHAWDVQDFWFWRPIIASYGYGLPEPQGEAALSHRSIWIERYLMRRLLRKDASTYAHNIQSCVADVPDAVALWGWGMYGIQAKKLLSWLGRETCVIFDRNAGTLQQQETGLFFQIPTWESVTASHPFIVISTLKYEDQILETLAAWGYREGEDCLRFSTLMARVARKYVKLVAKA